MRVNDRRVRDRYNGQAAARAEKLVGYLGWRKRRRFGAVLFFDNGAMKMNMKQMLLASADVFVATASAPSNPLWRDTNAADAIRPDSDFDLLGIEVVA